MEITYVNSKGVSLALDKKPYFTEKSGLYDFNWSIGFAPRPLYDGGKAVSRRRANTVRELTLYVYADNESEFNKAMNTLADVISEDIDELRAGRLYLGGQYLSCYISAGEKTVSKDWPCCIKMTLSVFPQNPCWCTERKFSLSVKSESDDGGLKYPKKYPYRYSSLTREATIVNDHYAPSPMIIKIFGPAENPRFSIGGAAMGLDVTLAQGEYAVIDQTERTIYKFSEIGEKTNIFNNRLKNGNIFKYAPAGASLIECTGDLNIDVTVVRQRSEPLWS